MPIKLFISKSIIMNEVIIRKLLILKTIYFHIQVLIMLPLVRFILTRTLFEIFKKVH